MTRRSGPSGGPIVVDSPLDVPSAEGRLSWVLAHGLVLRWPGPRRKLLGFVNAGRAHFHLSGRRTHNAYLVLVREHQAEVAANYQPRRWEGLDDESIVGTQHFVVNVSRTDVGARITATHRRRPWQASSARMQLAFMAMVTAAGGVIALLLHFAGGFFLPVDLPLWMAVGLVLAPPCLMFVYGTPLADTDRFAVYRLLQIVGDPQVEDFGWVDLDQPYEWAVMTTPASATSRTDATMSRDHQYVVGALSPHRPLRAFFQWLRPTRQQLLGLTIAAAFMTALFIAAGPDLVRDWFADLMQYLVEDDDGLPDHLPRRGDS